ncbi:MAG: futalosine hydrolase [Deltaproteobacteria bacterium CG23_combo_of_CG06-09_8_20_14_all_60_8]|nr:MAG: futalosine hydrolase [Deltaproteobacteria bacterium CG23_combo_of_CG06-09_8_20_14_all_60_8]
MPSMAPRKWLLTPLTSLSWTKRIALNPVPEISLSMGAPAQESMYLVVAATEMEMQPLRAALGEGLAVCLVTGLGPLETALTLTRSLEQGEADFAGVVNFGVAGAYLGTVVHLLDICLAVTENLGDLGICAGNETRAFPLDRLSVPISWVLDQTLLSRARAILAAHGVAFKEGNFVTVSGVSGTEERGVFLRDRFAAICENMEGAAVARVCAAYGLPLLEIRCVSNLVEDRDPGLWRLAEACHLGGVKVAAMINELSKAD